MADAVLEFILNMGFMGYWTSRLLLPVLSLGALQVEPIKENSCKNTPIGNTYQNEHGQTLLRENPATYLGIGFWIVLGILFLIIF